MIFFLLKHLRTDEIYGQAISAEKCWKRACSILSLWDSEKTRKKIRGFCCLVLGRIYLLVFIVLFCVICLGTRLPPTIMQSWYMKVYMGEHPKIFP